MPFELPALAYDFSALEPHIDARTMQVHHDGHHATYVANLNAAIDKHPELASRSVEQLLADLASVPDDIRTAVRNNGGGHFNHSIFWTVIGPQGGGEPSGAAATAITDAFSDYATFKAQLKAAALAQFGSGWAWAYLAQGKLTIKGFANQDNPISEGGVPVLGVDVWEHAYYLKYQNKRADYLDAWFNTINWNGVNQRLAG
ncbi:MAG TPA: superoxide dismutase [Candidatus Nitrosotalea sp.]|nr:superoxide dismutase [Candidatus Nitrosotalea sp.]